MFSVARTSNTPWEDEERCCSGHTVISRKRQATANIPADAAFHDELHRANVWHRGLIIRARSVSALASASSSVTPRAARKGIDPSAQIVAPEEGRSHARPELLNREIVFRLNQLLLPGFQFHFRAQRINRRRRAGVETGRSLDRKAPAPSSLGLRKFRFALHPRSPVNKRNQRQERQVARILICVLRGLYTFGRRPRPVDRFPIE